MNEELLLDVPFSADEVMAAVKNRKALGPDGLLPEGRRGGCGHLVDEDFERMQSWR